MNINLSDTIVALSTAPGTAAIAVIRLSGDKAIQTANRFFKTKNSNSKDLLKSPPRQAVFGTIIHEHRVVDEALVTVFRKPHSYTGEDCVEISVHGSPFIQQQVLQLMASGGARFAQPGEFTLRAFLNGKLDLMQAEAVHDLVSSHSYASHDLAMKQMRGGYGSIIKALRQRLIDFASLMELELDFSEEDVEFANRDQLKNHVTEMLGTINDLVRSFEWGNVIKNGIPVAIVGKPNAGKSTLLNVLLQDDKAIVSDIPGTTRDIVEDQALIEGNSFRFIDTAGLRDTTDAIEQIGVSKALQAVEKSAAVIYLFDGQAMSADELFTESEKIKTGMGKARLILAANKSDLDDMANLERKFSSFPGVIFISAKEEKNISTLKKKLVLMVEENAIHTPETMVTNARHAEALKSAAVALTQVLQGLVNKIPGDLLGLDIRHALHELGLITGEISSDDLLENIFGKFCIGK